MIRPFTDIEILDETDHFWRYHLIESTNWLVVTAGSSQIMSESGAPSILLPLKYLTQKQLI
jgi:hypothetical protein